MKAKIHDTTKGEFYIVNNESECRDKVDKSTYLTAKALNDIITMGVVIVEPIRGD